LTISGEKMSKSLGNIIPANEAIRKWGARRLRLWLLSAHYRTQLDFSEEALEQAASTLSRIEAASELVNRVLAEAEPESSLRGERLELVNSLLDAYYRFHEAMSSDFNTSKALAAVMEAVRLVNKQLASLESYTAAAIAARLFSEFNHVFNVLEEAGTGGPFEQLVDVLVKVRSELRRRKIYDLADEIRSELGQLGIQLMDYPGGKTLWRLVRKGEGSS
jgi:cysteinyl-tRNA synthetase